MAQVQVQPTDLKQTQGLAVRLIRVGETEAELGIKNNFDEPATIFEITYVSKRNQKATAGTLHDVRTVLPNQEIKVLVSVPAGVASSPVDINLTIQGECDGDTFTENAHVHN